MCCLQILLVSIQVFVIFINESQLGVTGWPCHCYGKGSVPGLWTWPKKRSQLKRYVCSSKKVSFFFFSHRETLTLQKEIGKMQEHLQEESNH